MSSLEHLTAAILEHGLPGAELAVARAVADLRRRGISPVAVDVLADPGQPEVARQRALGIIQIRLATAGVARSRLAA